LLKTKYKLCDITFFQLIHKKKNL